MNREAKKIHGVKGWLKALSIYMTIITPIFFIGVVVVYFYYLQETFSPQLQNFSNYIFLSGFILISLSVLSGIFLWKKKRYAVVFLKYQLIVTLIIGIINSIILLTFLINGIGDYSLITIKEVLIYIIQKLAYFFIPWLYIKYSKTVKNTLPMPYNRENKMIADFSIIDNIILSSSVFFILLVNLFFSRIANSVLPDQFWFIISLEYYFLYIIAFFIISISLSFFLKREENRRNKMIFFVILYVVLIAISIQISGNIFHLQTSNLEYLLIISKIMFEAALLTSVLYYLTRRKVGLFKLLCIYLVGYFLIGLYENTYNFFIFHISESNSIISIRFKFFIRGIVSTLFLYTAFHYIRKRSDI
ncbi:MAG: hypothetical protein GY756_03655 [bacterium]|nr:hypothetical protein [bacterium]